MRLSPAVILIMLKRPKILIIGTNEILRNLFFRTFTMEGIDVIQLAYFAEALEWQKAHFTERVVALFVASSSPENSDDLYLFLRHSHVFAARILIHTQHKTNTFSPLAQKLDMTLFLPLYIANFVKDVKSLFVQRGIPCLRKHARFEVKKSIRFRLSRQKEYRTAMMLNMSMGGLFLCGINKDLKSGDRITFEVHRGDTQNPPIRGLAEVRWSGHFNGQEGWGIRFLEVFSVRPKEVDYFIKSFCESL